MWRTPTSRPSRTWSTTAAAGQFRPIRTRRSRRPSLQSGYYGTDIVGQRQRNARRDLAERIELGQVIVGSPDTVLEQVARIRDELGAGILDLVVGVQLGERTMHSIELFGSNVLPRMREF